MFRCCPERLVLCLHGSICFIRWCLCAYVIECKLSTWPSSPVGLNSRRCLSSGVLRPAFATQQDSFSKISLRKIHGTNCTCVAPNSGQEIEYFQQLRLSLFPFWFCSCPPLSGDSGLGTSCSPFSLPEHGLFWISLFTQVQFLEKTVSQTYVVL